MPTGIQLTTFQVWICTGILFVLDVILALLAARFVQRDHIRLMRKPLIIISSGFFLLVWTAAMIWSWDWFYSYIFPPWARYLLPPLFAIGYSLLSLLMVWLCTKLPGSSAITWCVLGGIEGLLSHLYAIYSLGAASKPPIMQGTDPLAVLIFAVFEKAFYWSLILFAGKLLLPKAKRGMI